MSGPNRIGAIDVLIVGAGHAGAHTAIALRRERFAGSILMVGAEPDLPYERPPLSKDYLTGDRAFEHMQLRPADFYEGRDIWLRLGTRVERIDPVRRHAFLSDGTRIGFRTMVWATGGRPRRLGCPGHDLAGVHTIRTRDDVDRFRSELASVRDVVIVGGGYIGLETAAALRKLGKDVTIVEQQDRVLARVAGETLSRFYEGEHRRQGAVVRLSQEVACIEANGGRSCAVRLDSGERLPADAVVVGVGIVPEVGPLALAGAASSNGVHVDSWCRTSLSGIFAVGDVARHCNRFADNQWVRIESVQNAADQAATVARCITGTPAAYDSVPWFWSTQYDLKLQTVGLSQGYDEEIVRGDPATASFSIVYLRAGTVVALDCVNAPRDYVQGRFLVGSEAAPDKALLADMSIALKDLA